MLISSVEYVENQHTDHSKSRQRQQDPHRPSFILNIIHPKIPQRHPRNIRRSPRILPRLGRLLLKLDPGISLTLLDHIHNEAVNPYPDEHEEQHIEDIPLEGEIQGEPRPQNVQLIRIHTDSELLDQLGRRHVAALTDQTIVVLFLLEQCLFIILPEVLDHVGVPVSSAEFEIRRALIENVFVGIVLLEHVLGVGFLF